MEPGLEFGRQLETLVENARDLLDSDDPRSRVRAVYHIAKGVEVLEHEVLRDAQTAGMTWAEIGSIYGVSRQAVHRRFADDTVVPADFFDTLLASLDEPADVVPNLVQAAKRARHAVETG